MPIVYNTFSARPAATLPLNLATVMVGDDGLNGSTVRFTLQDIVNRFAAGLQPEITLASAATVNIGAAASSNIAISGTTTITAFDAVAAGIWRVVRFSGALVLTRNATSLETPTGASITTVAGDWMYALSLGSGNWRIEAYVPSTVSAGSRTPNIQAVTSAATVTPTFLNDMVKITAQAAALTLANPTGTAIDGLGLVVRIKDNGTARGITYGTQYRAVGVTLPTTTVISKTTYLAMVFNNDDTKWDVLAVGQEA